MPYVTENQTYVLRWIDTSAMICDPFTKIGNAQFKDHMVQTMESGYFDLTATEESQLKKLKTQKVRMQKALAEATGEKVRSADDSTLHNHKLWCEQFCE